MATKEESHVEEITLSVKLVQHLYNGEAWDWRLAVCDPYNRATIADVPLTRDDFQLLRDRYTAPDAGAGEGNDG